MARYDSVDGGTSGKVMMMAATHRYTAQWVIVWKKRGWGEGFRGYIKCINKAVFDIIDFTKL